MKIVASLLLLLATTTDNVGAFVPTSTIISTSSNTKASTCTTIHQSTFTPDDFAEPTISLLAKLNNAKREGAPRIESILEPTYAVTLATAAAGPFITLLYGGSLMGMAGNCLHVVLAALFWVQTLRVRCVFEEDGFEFYNLKGDMKLSNDKAKLTRKPKNFVTSTENKWSYDKVTGYQFYPSLEYPLICYFKETETPERYNICLLYTSPSPRDQRGSRMPSSA